MCSLPSLKGSNVWIISWKMLFRIKLLCSEAELPPLWRRGRACEGRQASNILLLLGMGIFQYPVNVLNASTPLKPFLIQEYWAKCGKTTLFCRLFHFYIRGKIILGTWCFNCCEIHSILITERRIRVTAMFVHEHMMCYHLQLSFQLEYDSLILFYIKKNPKQNLQPSLKKKS